MVRLEVIKTGGRGVVVVVVVVVVVLGLRVVVDLRVVVLVVVEVMVTDIFLESYLTRGHGNLCLSDEIGNV